MTGIGQKWPFAVDSAKVRLQIGKETFEPFAAAQNDFCVGEVCFAISNRKKLVGSDFVAE